MYWTVLLQYGIHAQSRWCVHSSSRPLPTPKERWRNATDSYTAFATRMMAKSSRWFELLCLWKRNLLYEENSVVMTLYIYCQLHWLDASVVYRMAELHCSTGCLLQRMSWSNLIHGPLRLIIARPTQVRKPNMQDKDILRSRLGWCARKKNMGPRPAIMMKFIEIHCMQRKNTFCERDASKTPWWRLCSTRNAKDNQRWWWRGRGRRRRNRRTSQSSRVKSSSP